MIEKCEIICGTKDELTEYFDGLMSKKAPEGFLSGKEGIRNQLDNIETQFKNGIGMIFYLIEKSYDNKIDTLNLMLVRDYVLIKEEKPEIKIC